MDMLEEDSGKDLSLQTQVQVKVKKERNLKKEYIVKYLV
jgi:hypothetical protein